MPAQRRRQVPTCRPEKLLRFAFLLISAGCEPTTSPTELYPGDVQRYVTRELAESITPDGRFILGPPEQGRYPQLTAEQATELAVAFKNTFSRFLLDHLEQDHGRDIDLDELRVGSPTYFAATPYEPVPPTASPGVRNAFGPYYLLYFVDPSGTPVLSVAVAGYSEARVAAGRVQLPQSYGNDFFEQGVRLGEGFSMPPSPEQAVKLASLATGARVSAIPSLVLGSRAYHPVHARWKVTLDREVVARGRESNEVRRTNVVFVGLRGEIFIPAPRQPVDEAVLDPATQHPFRLPRRPDRATVFERAAFPER